MKVINVSSTSPSVAKDRQIKVESACLYISRLIPRNVVNFLSEKWPITEYGWNGFWHFPAHAGEIDNISRNEARNVKTCGFNFYFSIFCNRWRCGTYIHYLHRKEDRRFKFGWVIVWSCVILSSVLSFSLTAEIWRRLDLATRSEPLLSVDGAVEEKFRTKFPKFFRLFGFVPGG